MEVRAYEVTMTVEASSVVEAVTTAARWMHDVPNVGLRDTGAVLVWDDEDSLPPSTGNLRGDWTVTMVMDVSTRYSPDEVMDMVEQHTPEDVHPSFVFQN